MLHYIVFMFFIGIPALAMAYGVVRTAYRLVTRTMPYELTELDELGLIVVVFGLFFGACWLLGGL